MSDEARRFTVSISPELAADAERLVEAGKAISVSGVVNEALRAHLYRELEEEARLWWEVRVAEARADPEISARVARERAHLDEQLRRFEEEHGRR